MDLLPEKYIITDKIGTGNSQCPHTYTLVYVGNPNCQKIRTIRSDVDFSLGGVVKIDKYGIKPWDFIYVNEQIRSAHAEMVACHNYGATGYTKVTLFGIDYGIITTIIPNLNSKIKMTRGDIVAGTKWGDKFCITENISTHTTYNKPNNIMVTHNMVVLDADMAGDYYTEPSYKHFFVHSSQRFSALVPSSNKLFAVQENDELLVWDDPRNKNFDILDNNTVNKLMAEHILREK